MPATRAGQRAHLAPRTETVTHRERELRVPWLASKPKVPTQKNKPQIATAPRAHPAFPERSKATLPTNLGAREAQHASRRSAREGVQPHAREYVELSDLGTIRSRFSNEMEAHDS